MNTNTPAHKAKTRHLCFFLVLCLPLAYGAVPGPCKHSVTKEHLLNLRRLIGNQLQDGCSITYNFTKHHSLSDVCYVKAAFPYVLDLLNTHFRYGRGSDNYNYTNLLKNLIYNIYSQKCIPSINEEIEDSPMKFAQLYTTSPRVGLEKVEEVFQMYKDLVTKNDKAVDWSCEHEYAEDSPLLTQKTDSPECQCSCMKMNSTPLKALVLTRSSRSATTTIAPQRPSVSPVLSHETKRSQAPEEALNSKPTQTSPALPQSEASLGFHTKTELYRGQHYGSTPGDFLNFIFSTSQDLMEGTSLDTESSKSSGLSSPIPPLHELSRIPPKGTLLLHSATSPPSQKSIPLHSSDRSTGHVLAKRAVDAKAQGINSEHLQGWITTTTSDPEGIHTKNSHLQIIPRATANNSFQTLHVDKTIAQESATAPPSLTTTERVSEYLRPPAEQPVDVSTPTHTQTDLHMATSLPESVYKAFSEATDCKDSKCEKVTEGPNDQTDRDYTERPSKENIQLTISLMNTTLVITSVCLALLLLTALIFCKKQRRPRGTEKQRLSTYDKLENP
ncbi:macrophage colony-stimulating factor 1a isoform X2 [Hoplias malabaricus]|uniref:macrophage colony-stimulating factor 1a isoform X2 n=1 Tax=Hoplias malabaricus TaxID=27720 RepID=UPI003461D3B3